MFRKNTASQFIHFQGVDSSTGGIKSGVSWTVRRCIDGTFAAATGTVTEDSTNGWYKFAMSQADTNGNNIAFNFTGTGAVPQTVNILTDGSPPDVNLKNAAGTAVTLDANNVLNVSTKYVGGTLQTARDIGLSVLLSSGTGTGQLDFTSGVVKANATQWLGGTIPAVNVTGVPLVDLKYTLGTLSAGAAGYIGLDWGHVNAPTTAVNLSGTTVNLTNTVTTYTGNTPQTGDNFARIGAAGAGLTALGDTRIANLDATVSSRLATSGYTAPPSAATVAAAVWAYVVEGSYTAVNYMRLYAAALLGKASGMATTTAVLRDTGDSKARITATVDSDGNRSAVTLDGS